jgi:putative transposase
MHATDSMARAKRIRAVGVPQHIVHRGNNRMDIFRSDCDYRVLLSLLNDASKRYQTDVHGYVLMRNHFHVLATPTASTGLERTIQLAASQYVGYFNRQYSRTGTLFEGRYRSSVIDDERYWIMCLRYIELNPVRAGLVAKPDEYRWSSYRANALGAVDALLTPNRYYLDLGGTAADRRQTWRRMCTDSLSTEELDRLRFAALEGRLIPRIPSTMGA